MPANIVVGTQWGDEGKGKIIDILASRADVVVRSQGGNNAGHTVVNNGEVYKLHLVPSGILYPNALNLIGAGVVLDPKDFIGELDNLESRGIKTIGHLKVDPRAQIVMPWHIALDGLSEAFRGGKDIGTTKRGIGPTYMDKYERTINSLSIRVKRWKELFDRYCDLISDKSTTDNQKAMYMARANESYMFYRELNAILIDILSLNDSEEEES